MTETPPRILVFIPTYNEADNVAALYQQLRNLGLPFDYLFVDDGSPDGTGDIVDTLAGADPSVHVIHRPGKLGIGSAHRAGIAWAYAGGYDLLVTMDCDFTHSPDYIRHFLEYAAHYDVVIGSRFLRDDSLPGWNLLRRTLTYGGHFMTRLVLGTPLDSTGAFRLYRLDKIPREIFDLASSQGYAFLFQSLYLLWRNGAAVKEVPVRLPARTQGHSKMRIRDALHSARTLFEMFARRLARRDRLAWPPEKLARIARRRDG